LLWNGVENNEEIRNSGEQRAAKSDRIPAPKYKAVLRNEKLKKGRVQD